MQPHEVEGLYMTPQEAAEYLGVNKGRVRQLAIDGRVIKLKGSVYETASVKAYRDKRGDKKGGRYPKGALS
jgi:hypothetical protein